MTTQGERIKQLAKAHGMTPAALARAADIDGSAMVNITGDHAGLGEVRAQRIADALGVDVSDVLLPKAEAETLATVAGRLRELGEQVAFLLESREALTQDLADARTRIARLERARKRREADPKPRPATGG